MVTALLLINLGTPVVSAKIFGEYGKLERSPLDKLWSVSVIWAVQ
jgi:hypothetical protein